MEKMRVYVEGKEDEIKAFLLMAEEGLSEWQPESFDTFRIESDGLAVVLGMAVGKTERDVLDEFLIFRNALKEEEVSEWKDFLIEEGYGHLTVHQIVDSVRIFTEPMERGA